MVFMQVNKSLLGFFVSGLALMAGVLIKTGCPTQQIESQYTSLQCGRMGYYDIYPFVPNATALEALGNKTLQEWNTSIQALDSQFAQHFPQGIAHFTQDTGTRPCLNNSLARTFYNNVTSAISSRLGNWTTVDIVEKAHAASTLRAEARKLTRDKMCDQGEVRVLTKRDRSEYGTELPTFAYMVGKYAARALSKCVNSICDIKNATCSAIIGGAEKTNRVYNWFARFF
jgi:hypothetical protein